MKIIQKSNNSYYKNLSTTISFYIKKHFKKRPFHDHSFFKTYIVAQYLFYNGFVSFHNYVSTNLLRPPWSAAAPFSKTVLTKMGMSPWGEPNPPTIEKPRLCWPLHNTVSEITFQRWRELPHFTVTIKRDSLTRKKWRRPRKLRTVFQIPSFFLESMK